MKNWHAFFEILRFPLEILLIAVMIAGIGNLMVNPVFGFGVLTDNSYVEMIGNVLIKTGQFVIVNFPLLFLLRLVARRSGNTTTILSAGIGYVIFNAGTMLADDTNLPATAYSSILGLNMSVTRGGTLTETTRYPLQTGIFATIVVAFITLLVFERLKTKNEYGFFGFISRDAACLIITVFFSLLAGIGFAYIWPYVIQGIQQLVTFIASDTTNPVNLALYGICDRFFGSINLAAMIRQPFWYTSDGGSWISVAGASITGDVSIWHGQINAGILTGMSGRFITPYYILNLFAFPSLIWAMYSMYTNKIERRRIRMLCIIVTIASWFSGTMLPIELMLLLLCPLLFAIHLAYTGLLFGILQALHIYLGFNNGGTTTIAAMPGTLPEFLSYVSNPSLQQTLVWILLIGVITGAVYYFTTKFYFKYLAIDLFKTGDKDRAVDGTIQALGGIENIRMSESSVRVVTVSVYDPGKVDIQQLRRLGSYRVYETKFGYNLCFGSASTMIRDGIEKERRNKVRDTE